MIVLPVPSLISPPVCAELRQADLMTSEECRWLYSIRGVVGAQRAKSPELVAKTADVLRRNGFEKESRFLAGRQSRPSSICLCYVVHWSPLMSATLWHPLLSTDRCPYLIVHSIPKPEAACSRMSIRHLLFAVSHVMKMCEYYSSNARCSLKQSQK